VEQRAHHAGQRFRVSRWKRQRSAAGHFQQRGGLRHDAWSAGGHRLHYGQPESLIERRLHGTRARCIQFDEIALVHATEPYDSAARLDVPIDVEIERSVFGDREIAYIFNRQPCGRQRLQILVPAVIARI